MNKEKCMYCSDELDWLGYLICNKCWLERLSPKDREKIFPKPQKRGITSK